MSTHRRAWKQRAGVVVALVVGALLTVPATPAHAAKITSSDGSVTIDAGRSSSINVVVAPDGDEKKANLSVTGLPDGVSCTRGCGEVNFDGLIPGPKSVTVTLAASADAPGANGTQASVRVEGDSKRLSVTVKPKSPAPTTAPPESQTVKLISGKVTVAANGEPVPNATVMLEDSTGRKRSTTSNDSGNYRFTGSSSEPIAPGRIVIGASKENIVNSKTINASAGQSLTGQGISLAIKTEVTPSATPSASAEAVPTEEATEEVTEETAEATQAAQVPTSDEDSGGFGSFLIILLGGLLVAAGVGTIVLLWMRRKNAEEDDAPGGAAAAGAAAGARGGYRGTDDQTRVVNRVGADPNMVGSSALSDAPTMMHRPIVDDVPPDPYGAPPEPYGAGGQGNWAGSGYGDEPAPGGYGQPGGYGNAPASGGGYGAAGAAGAAAGAYGNAPASGGGYGNAPASGGGYGATGAPAGGYGDAPASGGGYGNREYGAPAGAAGYAPQDQGGGYGERFDEPTGRYTGEATGTYAPAADPYPTSTYQPEQGHGYGQPEPGSYGRAPEPTGGYGAGNGYGQPEGGYNAGAQQGYEGGGYNQPNGYDQRGGYDQQAGGGYGGQQQAGGYGQQGGYGQEPPQQREGGYDAHGYDQQQGGGYHGDQAQPGRARPEAPGAERGGRRLDWLDD